MPPRHVAVPKTSKNSFNPERPASNLLRAQAVHLHDTLKWHAAEIQAALADNPLRLHTESEISKYVEKVSRILHPHAAKRKKK